MKQTILDRLREQLTKAEEQVLVRYENAKSAHKEGAGTHRNVGDSGRIGALWMEKVDEVASLKIRIARESE